MPKSKRNTEEFSKKGGVKMLEENRLSACLYWKNILEEVLKLSDLCPECRKKLEEKKQKAIQEIDRLLGGGKDE